MKLDFSQFKIIGIDGKEFPLEREDWTWVITTLSNAIRNFSKKIDLCDIARAIKKKESIEVSQQSISDLKVLLSKDIDIGIFPFVAREMTLFIDQQINGKKTPPTPSETV